MRIGITLGDPAGIGPEIVAAALDALGHEYRVRVVVYGHAEVLARAANARSLDVSALTIVEPPGVIRVAPGAPDETSGAAQVAYLEAAIEAARRGELAGLATAPISKTWAKRAGFAFPGHTELLAARFAAPHVVMLFAGPRLTVALATIHLPLRDVPAALTTASLRRTIELVAASLRRDFGIAQPRVGVVGLNPHAGEGGLLGAEDAAIIAPALADLPYATGPLVPDAAFRDALDRAKHDALVAMYHDQGLIPVKLVDFDDAVNVTLGLPIVRTSPDHGTAYDIAGRGIARARSMQRAIALAFAMAERRAAAR